MVRTSRQGVRGPRAAGTALVLVACTAVLAAGCFFPDGGPTAIVCPGDIELTPQQEQVFVGDRFVVEARHVIEKGCSDFTWEVEGGISIDAIENPQATFLAEEPGEASVLVRNLAGATGSWTFEVLEPGEEGTL